MSRRWTEEELTLIQELQEYWSSPLQSYTLFLKRWEERYGAPSSRTLDSVEKQLKMARVRCGVKQGNSPPPDTKRVIAQAIKNLEDNPVEAHDPKDEAIRKLQQENLYLEERIAMLRKPAQAEEKQNAIAAAVARAADKYFQGVSLQPFPKAKPIIPKIGKPTKQTAVAVFSDAHFGENVSKVVTQGINEYDLDIAAMRSHTYVEKLLELVNRERLSSKIDDLVLLILGDMVSGLIHEELMTEGAFSVPEQSYTAAYLSAQMVRSLAAHFKHIEVRCVCGNHGRTGKDYKFKNPRDSYDWTAYVIMSILLRDVPNVHVLVHDSWMGEIEVMGHWIGYAHGDGGKRFSTGGYAGVPFYGLMQKLFQSRELWKKRGMNLDLFVQGHLHSPFTLPGITVNGCLVGEQEMTVKGLFPNTMDPAHQWLFGVTEKRCPSFNYWMDVKDSKSGKAFDLPLRGLHHK